SWATTTPGPWGRPCTSPSRSPPRISWRRSAPTCVWIGASADDLLAHPGGGRRSGHQHHPFGDAAPRGVRGGDGGRRGGGHRPDPAAAARPRHPGRDEAARDIQQRLQPTVPSALAGLEVGAMLRPSTMVGGDFFDIFPMGERIGVAVGDVSGKGIPAALLMVMVRTLLREIARGLSEPA